MLFSKFKSRQLRPAGKSASYRKFSVVDASYAGFQAFWAMAGTWWTDLSRKPRLKYWSFTLPAIWMKRVQVRLGLPVSYARTPSGNAPLNVLARLILSPNPSEPHTLKNAEHCQKHLPAWVVFERQTCVDPTFYWISL